MASYHHRPQKRFPLGLALFLGLLLATLVGGLWGALRLYQRDLDGSGTEAVLENPLPEDDLLRQAAEAAGAGLEQTGLEQKSFTYEYGCQPYSLSLPLYRSVYDYYASQDKNFYYRGSLPSDWERQYYQKFLDSDYDLEAIRELIAGVAGQIGSEGDELVLALTSLVQHLRYDCDKLFSLQKPEGAGYQTYFPYETLYRQDGVCMDTSILLAKILRELGYGAAFLVYDGANHMAVGIRCPVEDALYLEDGIGYCYIETTAPTRIGIKPAQIGSVTFTEEPELIPIAGGESFNRIAQLNDAREQEALLYGGYILELAGCQEINLYKEIHDREAVMASYESQMDQLEAEIEAAEAEYFAELELSQEMGCQGTVSRAKYDKCLAQVELVNQGAARYNQLVEDFTQLQGEYQAYYGEYQRIFAGFEALLGQSYQSCSYVAPESLDIQTPAGE